MASRKSRKPCLILFLQGCSTVFGCRNRTPESTITIEYNVRSTSGVEQHCVPIGMSGKKVIIELRCEGRIGLPQWLSDKESACSAGAVGDTVLIPGSGRSPGGWHGNPLQYSCLENPMDRGAWWATVHKITNSWTQLKWLSTYTQLIGKITQISNLFTMLLDCSR